MEPDTRVEELTRQRASAVEQLQVANKGLKACRRKSGAAAHKRSWYFEESIKKAEARIDQIDKELQQLGPDVG